MTAYNNSPENSTNIDDCPILKRHYFAEDIASVEFGGSWVHPKDRDFTDRPPPGALAAVKPMPREALDVVSALLAKRRAA